VTESQRQTLVILACLTLLHGRRPALDELATVLRLRKPSVLNRLHWLSKKGLCQRPHSRARWAITTPGLAIASTALAALRSRAAGAWEAP
jgi:DNA-binding IclR family transcriptional regulator